MPSANLLDKILSMLRSIKNNPEQLERLYRYMVNELHAEETADAAIMVPDRFAPLVKEVADNLSAGLVCYINPDTLEKIDIPQSVLNEMILDGDDDNEEMYADDVFYADLKRIQREWKQTITISPPEPGESFSIMEQFVNELPESRISKMLAEALSGRKPFRHFNSIIYQSPEREKWFVFRQKCLQNYAAGILAERLWNNESGD